MTIIDRYVADTAEQAWRSLRNGLLVPWSGDGTPPSGDDPNYTYVGYGNPPLYLPEWDAPADAVVDSWSAAETAAAGGATVIHLQAGSYGGHTWDDHEGVFIRNVPGDHVSVGGEFSARVPDITLAGIEKQGRFRAEYEGRNATLYRSLLTGSAGLTFTSLNTSGDPITGRMIEVHSVNVGGAYSGVADDWSNSDICHINNDASGYVDGCWISGRTDTKGVFQVINGGDNMEMRNTWVGRGSSGQCHMISGAGIMLFEDNYFDWWPHPVGGGIGWEFRSPNTTIRRMTAFRPFWGTTWDSSFAGMTIEGNTFYDVDPLGRNGAILFSGNDNRSSEFPDNTYRAAFPTHTLPWVEPAWWGELGISGVVQEYPELTTEETHP